MNKNVMLRMLIVAIYFYRFYYFFVESEYIRNFHQLTCTNYSVKIFKHLQIKF